MTRLASRLLALLVLTLGPGCSSALPAEQARGTGLPFSQPWSVRVLDDGRILVTDSDAGSILEVDRATGNRRVVISSTAETPLSPGGVAPAPGGRLYVADMARRAVLLFRGDGRLLRVLSQEGVRGAGPGLQGNLRLEPLPGGQLAVLDEERDAVLAVDPSTGDRRLLVQEGLVEAVDLALWRDRLVVLDTRPGRVLEVGPQGVTLLIDLRDGHGPAMPSPEGLGIAADGSLLVSDNVNGVVVSVDPDTLARRAVSRPDLGDGPTLSAVKDPAGLPDGAILASVPYWRCLIEVAPDGRRRLVSGQAPPSQPLRVVPYSLARQDDRLLIGDVLSGGVLEIAADRVPAARVEARTAVPAAESPLPIALAAGPEALFILDGIRGILRQDGATGTVEVLLARGQDGFLADPGPLDLATGPGDRLWLGDGARHGLFAVTPRALRELTGAGPPLLQPYRLLVQADGSMLVCDAKQRAVVRVDLATGERTRLGGAGPELDWPVAITATSDGRVVVTDESQDSVLLLDPVTGDRTLASGPTRGSGPPLYGPTDSAPGPGGLVFLADPGVSDLTVADLDSGDRRTVELVPTR